MIIAVGSVNPVKVQAVEEVVRQYEAFAKAKVVSLAIPSDVSEQPFSMEETIQGAKNRAKNVFNLCPSCVLGIGIESGLVEAPGTKTGYLETCICCITNEKGAYFIGLSCGFEIPPQILELVLKEKMDLSQACHHCQVTTNPRLGSAEGLIGILTKGRIDRKEYTKQSVITALGQFENADWYKY